MKSIDFKLVANGGDITQQLRNRLLNLTIRDVAGEESDTVSIELDNRDLAIAFPATGANLDISIGYVGALVFKGCFEVDELAEPLDDDTLTIHAKAAKVKGSFKAPKDKTFDDITLGELAEQIAKAHGFEATVSTALAAIKFDHIDQRAESDMNLLTRLAREHGAIAKPVANRIVIALKGESKTVSGNSLPNITISDPANSSGTVTIQERGNYKSVMAHHFDEAKQTKVPVTFGEGEPQYVIRRLFTSEKEAKSAAQAKFAELQRGKSTLSLTRPLTPELTPECKITLSNHKPSANGEWLIEVVEHLIGGDGIGQTRLDCVIPS